MVTLEIFFLGFGLTITEINIKEVQKRENRKKKCKKHVGMACHKVYKQGRDDIKMKADSSLV